MDSLTDRTAAQDSATTNLSRRGFLRAGLMTGGGIAVATVAACTPTAAAPTWTFAPTLPPNAVGPSPSAAPSTEPSDAASHAPASPGMDHDANAATVVKRFLNGEATTLPLGNHAYAREAALG